MHSNPVLALESTIKLNDGTSVLVPDGWTSTQHTTHLTLKSPEGDLSIDFISLPSHGHFENEIAEAWKIVNPSFSLKPFAKASPPPSEGWDSLFQIAYDVPASESRTVIGLLKTFKGKAYINLISGSNASFGKRGPQMFQTMDAWKPLGLKEEDLSASTSVEWEQAQSTALEKFVRSTMLKFKVPGVSIGIVQNGRLVYSKGFGVSDMNSKKRVTPNTLFMIGSTTKPLTTLLISKLINDKKITWETPISSVLSDFSLADPVISQKIQFKHTVCACTGMPRQDLNLIFKYHGIKPEQRLVQMKSMKPTTGFGETFQYSNWLVAAGGYAAAKVFDKESDLETAYLRAMKEMVFSPLGMTHTVLKREEAVTFDSARPHGFDSDDNVSTIPLELEDFTYSIAPSGAVWSNVGDMAKYLSLELSDGLLPSGTQYIDTDIFLKRREKVVKIDGTSSYGLGLFIEKKQGIETFGHGGNTNGFSSDMYFIPSKKIGVVVLTNLSGASRFLGAIKQKLFEIELGATHRADKLVKYALERNNENRKKIKETISSSPTKNLWIKELVGAYENEDLGPATIRSTKKGYEIEFSDWKSELGTKSESNGEMLLSLISAPWGGGLDLIVKDKGRVLVIDDNQHRYEFRKKVERSK